MAKINSTLRKHAPKFLSLFAFLLLWQLVVTVFRIKEFILPSPAATFATLFVPAQAAQYTWIKHIQATLAEILASFVMTAVSGFLIALAIRRRYRKSTDRGSRRGDATTFPISTSRWPENWG